MQVFWAGGGDFWLVFHRLWFWYRTESNSMKLTGVFTPIFQESLYKVMFVLQVRDTILQESHTDQGIAFGSLK